ncbi:predicted protein [Thalassiosira pseudonana CCMP1335]|uniref:aspartate kinase n=1 Tax=Thalassiosira pseudonana TaxID=35128 RepID=B8C772_THAPS|nr:predicted protein [Thalassiosira pseudonana CCMP1335]EED90929.1 predicted protein [Thalassiosira pseudonana CCMP1335]
MTNEKLTSTAAVLLLALSASLTTIGAFSPTPLNRLTNQRSLIVKYDVPSSSSSVVSPLGLQRRIVYEKESNQTGLFMSEDDDDGEANEIDNDGEETASTEQSSSDVEADAAAQISSYKSSLNPRRSFSSSSSSRPGSSAITPLDVTMKFGGSSLANSERVDRVAHLIQDRIRPPPNEDGTPSDEIPVRPRAVICSAMGKTTNSLLSAGEMALEGRVDVEALRTLHLGTCRDFDLPERTREDVEKLLDECEDMLNGVRLIQELSPKSLDQLVSYGERCSVRIMAARLNQIGVPAQAFDAWDVGVVTDDNYGDAKLLPSCIESIRGRFSSRIDPNVVAVVTGFIGHNTKGRITTLGRGGSDLTATAIGAALKVDEVQVWKDVDGILTADPRLVKNAVPVSKVSYDEASELAYFGAQVLHPIAMQPALKANIPVRVKNSYNPSAPGSVIDKIGNPERMVTAITCKRNVKLLDIHSLNMLGAYGFLGAVFADFEKHKCSVDVLASSEVSVSVTLDKKQHEEDITELCNDLSKFAEVELHRDRAILTLIADVKRSSDVLATVFRSFSAHGVQVEMMSQGASKVNISFIVREDQIDDAILNLHSCFFEGSCDVGMIEGGELLADK